MVRKVLAVVFLVGAITIGCSPSDVPQGAQAVNVAYQYLGVPYVWGGSTPSGFDCSGLTQWVYAQIGKPLPRTAEEQFEATQRVPQAWAQKGDLIFFGVPGAIYHVGIYEGNGLMVHAPVPGSSVQIIAIWTSDYYVGRVA